MTANCGTVPRHGAAALILLGVLAVRIPARPAPAASDQGTGATPSAAAGADRSLSLKQAGKEFLSDAGRIWSSPARLKGRHIVPIFALAAGTAILIASDEAIRDGVQTFKDRQAWVGDVGPVITQMGGVGAFAAAGAFLGTGLLFKDVRARDTGYLAASAMIQAFLVDNLFKGLTGRQRPSVADGEDHWAGPAGFFKRYEKDQEDVYGSFPSGHTATAFALATVVALQYRDPGWIPFAAYAMAAGVGFSRLTMDKHWASDVALGAVAGHLVARLVVRNHARRGRLVPMVACVPRGLALSFFYDLDRQGWTR